ncbi:NDP-hexose 2,3-dehydratase [Streptomyces lucensis JCM 4490]|uniref:NDP-hexose 2,3-dehydratase n=1 Tax=Streptomyces lucensis JCM 4490 TaxID=1306176 RepID=A0A918J7S7_9ACTN|nr:NDP-hexose 2,3-dehydratase family protein [Streptomyces lucensis]GGW54641.1 NDP-hexose 2,3-dehydratase [Streptomyces lucensis JCM 4490]
MTEAAADTPFRAWWRERASAHRSEVTRIPFSQLDGWGFERHGGNLVHTSGKFFTVEGLRIETDDGAEARQPIIHQPEIGVLGILVKEFGGVVYCLMQAKMEPGNLNTVQLSPTVQATRSNYLRVHRGGRTRYLEHFWGADRGSVLVDVLQSEQGVWFWHKHNRNMIVQVDGDVPVHEAFRWVALPELLALLHSDNLVNMDARTVLGCLPRELLPAEGRTGAFAAALRRSYETGSGTAAIRSWLHDVKGRGRWNTRLIPLDKTHGWTRGSDEISADDGSGFRVIAVRVRSVNREVPEWTQPLLAPREEGLAAFLVRRTGDTLRLLVQARYEPGLLDHVELAPTVRTPPVAADEEVPFLKDVLSADPRHIRFDTLLSEEGGRFHHALTRYQVIELPADHPAGAGDHHRWMTVGQLMELVRHGHYLNIEARSLLACLHSLR